MDIKKLSIFFFVMIGAIIASGWLLNQAGKGSFGAWVKNLAKETTNGYGAVGA